MTWRMHFLGAEEVTDFEQWLMSLESFSTVFYGKLREFPIKEWAVTPAFGGQLVLETTSPEGHEIRFSVTHDELAEEYRQVTGKDPDFEF